ncbi:MAG TPA: sulfate permease [Burkholderiales bacterium]
MNDPVRFALVRHLPILGWGRAYNREDLSGDLLAGVITAILLVPQGMAFGLLAGLPAQAGLYASILPPIVYALFGTSRTLAVGPVSVASIMVAQALAGLPAGANHLSSALLLALLGGVVLLALGVARLGMLANFLSHPVLSGFTSAAAVIIVLSQLPSLIGLSLPARVPLAGLPAALGDGLARLNLPTLGLGVLSVALLLLAGSPLERALTATGISRARAGVITKTAPLAVVAITTALVAGFSLDVQHGVAVVGTLPEGLPIFALEIPTWSSVAQLAPAATLIAIVGYVESVSIAKTLANRRRQAIDPNQELLALGAANFAAAVSGGMPVAGGFSRTMVNYNAGACTQAAAIVTAVLVGAVALFFTPLLAHVPKAALAAIIIVAVSKLIDLRTAVAAWRYDRNDGAVLVATAAGVLLLGIEAGLTAGVVLSLLLYIWRASRPHLAVLGRLPGSEHFRNVKRYQDLETWPHLLLLRVDEHLSFANSAYLEQVLMEHVARAPKLKHLVLVCSGINGIDFSALEMLTKLISSLKDARVTLHLAEVKGPVMDKLRATGLLALLEPGRVFLSAHEAVEVLTVRAAPRG